MIPFSTNKLPSFELNDPQTHHRAPAVIAIVLFAAVAMIMILTGCGSTAPAGKGSVPAISSFTANPTSINSGSSSTLSWTATGATTIAITPGTITSTSASGSTTMSPTATTTYTLTATNASGSSTSSLTLTVNAPGKP